MTTTDAAERQLPIARELGALIHQAMWKQRKTQSEVAALIGVKQNTLGRKLRGLVPITVDELMILATGLDLDPVELWCACRDSNPKPSLLVFCSSDWGLAA